MILIGRADELIIGDVETVTHLPNGACYLVYELLRGNAGLLRLDLDLLSMLVGSRLEEYIVALLSLESCDGVCQHDFIIVANVRLTGGVSDGRCKIIGFLFHISFLPFSFFVVS